MIFFGPKYTHTQVESQPIFPTIFLIIMYFKFLIFIIFCTQYTLRTLHSTAPLTPTFIFDFHFVFSKFVFLVYYIFPTFLSSSSSPTAIILLLRIFSIFHQLFCFNSLLINFIEQFIWVLTTKPVQKVILYQYTTTTITNTSSISKGKLQIDCILD